MSQITYAEVLADKKQTDDKLKREFMVLKTFDAEEPSRCFLGNKIIYHFQMDQLCRTSTSRSSLHAIFQDQTALTRHLANVEKLKRAGSYASRVFEAWRINAAVVIFKAANAMYVYKKMGATAVLDPTAGWGGRLLGAAALDIPYTGIDTNLDLKRGYDEMMATLDITNAQMLWTSCLDTDFSQIDYDHVLTSPPYINQELYSHMSPWPSKKAFYSDFLIPLLDKCRRHIRRNGWTCFNISPKMYEELLAAGYTPAHETLPLSQQTRIGKARSDQIYCWRPL